MKKIRLIFTLFSVISFLLWTYMLFRDGLLSSQLDVFYMRCDNAFADFTNICGYSSGRDVYNNTVNGLWEKGYPPICYMVAFFFSKFGGETEIYTDYIYQKPFLVMFVFFEMAVYSVIYAMVCNSIKGSKFFRYITAFIITFTGFMIPSLERGNIIGVCIIFLLMYVFLVEDDNVFYREIALMSLGFAAAFKIAPAIFGVYLIYKKRYKDAVRCAIYGMAFFLLPFLFFKGGLSNLYLMTNNLKEFLANYSDMAGFSGKAVIGQIILWINPSFFITNTLGAFFRIISLLISLLCIIGAGLFEKKWKCFLAIAISAIFVPGITTEYCLAYFIPAIVMFVNEDHFKKIDIIALVGWCFIYTSYLDSMRVPWHLLGIAILVIYALIELLRVIGDFFNGKNYKICKR